MPNHTLGIVWHRGMGLPVTPAMTSVTSKTFSIVQLESNIFPFIELRMKQCNSPTMSPTKSYPRHELAGKIVTKLYSGYDLAMKSCVKNPGPATDNLPLPSYRE